MLELDLEETVADPEEKKQRPFIEPGWYVDLSNDDYHGSFGLSSSRLKKLVEKTPAHLDYEVNNPKDQTVAMGLGTAVHTLVLEPEKFDDEIAVMPVLNLRTKDGREKRDKFAAENKGKTIITPKQRITAGEMAKAVFAHPTANTLLQDSIRESSIYWWYKSMDPDDQEQYKELVKVRPDAVGIAHPVVLDLKSVLDGSYSGFVRAINRLYYHVSAAMYLEGVNQCKPLLDATGHYAYTKFIFICVENLEPYEVSVYELSKEYLEIGTILYRRALITMGKATEQKKATGEWPGYPEDVRVIEPPPWARTGYIV